MSTGLVLFYAVITLLGNAFFVGAEFGLISARRSKIELEAIRGSKAAKKTLQAMEQVPLMLAGAQLGVTLCSLVFGAVAEPFVDGLIENVVHYFGMSDTLVIPVAILITLTLMTYVHVVIGEMVPKNLSLASPTKIALFLIPPLAFIVNIFSPLITAINYMATGVLRLVGVQPKHEISSSFSRDEVSGFIKESLREGLLDSKGEQLLSGSLQFNDKTIEPITMPIDKIIFAPFDATPADIEELTFETGFSRFPVMGNKGTPLKKYIHLKDTLRVPSTDYNKPLPRQLLRTLDSVKQNATLRDALSVMQSSGSHLAKVVNTSGVSIGMVALEDVLEELVGEIRDNIWK